MTELPINQVVTGDCRDVMSEWPDNCIDLTVTSPPYDNLRENEEYNADFDFEKMAEQLYRVTKEGGIVVWVVGDQTIDGSESLTSFKQALHFKEKVGFKIHDTMIWKKPGPSTPSNNRYHQIFEYMFVLSKDKPKTFNPIKDRKNKRDGTLGKPTRRQKDGSLEEVRDYNWGEYGQRFNIWELKTATHERPCQSLPHPAMFSEELAEDHIKSWSNKEDIVLDPMCGSGTTLKMARKNLRNYVGIEISKKYCEIARERVNGIPERLEAFC